MYTNQSVTPDQPVPPERVCHHAPGAATIEDCAYLHALARLRDWTERAERAHQEGEPCRQIVGQLWLLTAELATALDQCPNGDVLCLMRLPTRR